MKRVLSLALALLLTLPLILFSCGEQNRKYDGEAVVEAAIELIKKSEDLNEIFWGRGIAYLENDADRNGYYYAADPDSLARFGIENISDLRIKTLATFSAGYADTIFNTVLSPLGDEDTGIVGYTRYFQSNDKIMVFSKYTALLNDDVTYLYDTLKATHSKGETVFVSLDVMIKRGEKEQKRTIEVGLIEEEGVWKIDTPTYAVYRES